MQSVALDVFVTYIVSQFCQLVRSELGKGTSILIALPLDCEATKPVKKRGNAPTPFELARKQNEIAVRKSA